MTFHLAITFGSQAVGSLNKISGLRAENAVVVRQISSVVSCIKIEELKDEYVKHILEKLILIKTLDNHQYYNIQKFIGYCSYKYLHRQSGYFLQRVFFR